MTLRRILQFLFILTVVLTSCKPIQFTQTTFTVNTTARHWIEDISLKTFGLDSLEVANSIQVNDSTLNLRLRRGTYYIPKKDYCKTVLSFDSIEIPRTPEELKTLMEVCQQTSQDTFAIKTLSIIKDTILGFYKYDINEIIDDGTIEKRNTLSQILKPNCFYEVRIGLRGIQHKKNTTYVIWYSTNPNGQPVLHKWFTDATWKMGTPHSVKFM